mgnify:CR=1 FL=1
MLNFTYAIFLQRVVLILIRESQARGIDVTAEATPHHFTLCDEDVPAYDSNFKMNLLLEAEKT